MRRVAYSGVDIVRYHDDARVIAEIDELYKVIHFICRDGIEPRNRLVEQQELFRRAHRARKQNALLLAAGELKIAAVGYIVNAEALHVLGGRGLILGVIE